jgi:hypothetical protein
MLDFLPNCPAPKSNSASQSESIPNNQDIPKEMEIFSRNEADFLPPGKTLADLTPEELETLKLQYRFSFFRPGIYQAITGKKNSY